MESPIFPTIFHVFLVKETDHHRPYLVHTASSFEKAQEWVKENGKKQAGREKYYFRLSRGVMDDPCELLFVNHIADRIYAYMDNEGEVIDRFDVWQVYTNNRLTEKEDRLISSNLTKDSADEEIYFGHADEPSPDRSDYWNYVRVPHGFKPHKYQRRS